MRKALLFVSIVFALASFTNVDNQKIVLKDIDGTLLQSYAVIDKEQNTITFTVDANTTVSSSIIDGEFKIFLVENDSSNKTADYTLNVEDAKSVSFDNYFETSFDVASQDDMIILAANKYGKPRGVVKE